MRSRIAIFEGYGVPKKHRRKKSRRMGFDPREMPVGMGFDPREMPQGMGAYGAPLFNNPRLQGYGAPLFNNPRLQGYGRRGYYVPAAYGPTSDSSGRRLSRKGYKVKKRRNSKAQTAFKKAAKKCAKRRSGSFQVCMRKTLKKKSRRSRR